MTKFELVKWLLSNDHYWLGISLLLSIVFWLISPIRLSLSIGDRRGGKRGR
jgi:hypothetical protein